MKSETRVLVSLCASADGMKLVRLEAPRTGAVRRTCLDGGLWVELDRRDEAPIFPFPSNSSRARWITTNAEFCRAEK